MSEKISIAISIIKRYLNDRFEDKDKKILFTEIINLATITIDEFYAIKELETHIDYSQLQTTLAVLYPFGCC